MNGPREIPVYTAEELLLILDRYWRSTGTWDPLVNKSTEGRAMTEHEQWVHHTAVGQRMAVSRLKSAIEQGALRRVSRAWATDEVDPPPMAGEGIVDNGWRACCEAYVEDGKRFVVEWLHGEGYPPDSRDSLRQSALEHMNVLESIIRGEYEYRETSGRCPWHYMDGPFGWQNYRAVMEAAKDPGFLDRLEGAPIEIVPQHTL